MAEAKPLASLSGSLLARKGAAKPAMRRQGMAGFGQMLTPQDDLGWNDMGYDVNPTPSDERAAQQRIDLTPMISPIQAVRGVSHADADERGEPLPPISAPIPEVVRQRQLLAEKMGPRVPLNLGGHQPALRASAPKPEEMRPEEIYSEEMHAEVPEIERETSGEAPVAMDGISPEIAAPEMPAPDMAVPDMPALDTVAPQRATPAPGIVAGSMASAQAVPAQTTPAGSPRILERTPRRQPMAAVSKAAFTLRIDPERHLRLRLASAVTRRSAQVILIEALDKYLKSLPEIDALAHQVPQKK